ncbi:MAG TPA: amidohydrolase family protein [Bacteroidia bacterium]|nr:amidohydrolase family protein [Bacteroidia bacterium]HNT79430.1 amidohydrolase family protein [Bacteroidia bacterium]
MKKLLTILFTLFLLNILVAQGQEGFPSNGISDERSTLYAFTNATIYIQYNQSVSKATLLIQKGKIIDVGVAVKIPEGAKIIDLNNMYIYPAFVDLYSDFGMPDLKKTRPSDSPSKNSGALYWNPAIRSHIKAETEFNYNDKAAESLRNIGFGFVLSHVMDGISRGTGVFLNTANNKAHQSILSSNAASFYSFNKGTSKEDYPGSLMGSIALLRQSYFDAKWYVQNIQQDQYNQTLESFYQNLKLPSIFECSDYQNILRAASISSEWNIPFIYKGSGDEYKRMTELKSINAKLIVPLNYPDAYDVSDLYDALNVDVSDMKHWELAPANSYMLYQNKIPFCFTTAGLKNTKDFFKNIRKAIAHGLPEEEALKALTYNPAEFINAQQFCGSLQKNMPASFTICSNKIFDEKNQMISTWVYGIEYSANEIKETNVLGNYFINLGPQVNLKLEISGDALGQKIVVKEDSVDLKAKSSIEQNVLSINATIKSGKNKGNYRIKGLFDESTNTFAGNAQLPAGNLITWQSSVRENLNESAKESKKDSSVVPTVGKVWYPNMAFGFEELPKAEFVLIKNATLWTNEVDGKISNGDILIGNGKILKVGKVSESDYAKINNLKTIDAAGKHVTPGIIDEHSHIAVKSGVNEGTQAISAEVSIGSVINSDDINIYRQLAGGVTTSHLLHGSANPIGGQTALIKLRWGKSPEEMKFEGADGFIKFALGENVKQANWGDQHRSRYPQTRMGVEQLIIDAFNQAKKYEQDWKQYNASKNKNNLIAPRRDIEKDILLEILNKKRFITCHSYQQAEINMLMHVADSFNFTLNTFTHILEGYKVADKMKEHGAGASSFSDWWAYKYEVIEAIPHNGSIMNKMGIVTAFNSDDAEMARRLNQEAAKAVKYGNTSEEDALKFVTLNPAKLLHIDHRVGSLKEGKDADIVLWNDHPLSVYATVNQTYIDGICYYDQQRDKALQETLKLERTRLMDKMQDEKNSGAKTQSPNSEPNYLYNCNELEHCSH